MRSPFRKLVFAALSLVLVAVPLLGSRPAWAASPALDEAQSMYDAAKFDDAIVKLRESISNGAITGSDVVSARALMARCLVKAGKRLEAKQAFKTVLRTDPGFKLDAVTVPPDEMEVFNLAAKEIQAEQIEAGQRIPASLGFIYGVGSGDNKDFAKIQDVAGGSDKLKSKSEFGVSVRFPLRPRLSLDLELARFRSTGHDSIPDPNGIKFEASAIPMVVSLYYTAITGNKFHLNLFGGGGPMVASRASIDLPLFGFRIQIADEKVGTFLHGGTEAEWMLFPKLSVTGRVEGRYAKATGLYKNNDLQLYGDPRAALKNREVNFSGYGAYIGLRGYIGY